MWRNIMRSTKSKKISILHYSIDIDIDIDIPFPSYIFFSFFLQYYEKKAFLLTCVLNVFNFD
jgi:hypothetical protein